MKTWLVTYSLEDHEEVIEVTAPTADIAVGFCGIPREYIMDCSLACHEPPKKRATA